MCIYKKLYVAILGNMQLQMFVFFCQMLPWLLIQDNDHTGEMIKQFATDQHKLRSSNRIQKKFDWPKKVQPLISESIFQSHSKLKREMFNFRVVPAPKQRKQENKLFSGVFNNAESCLKRAAGVLEYKERALNKLQMRKELRHTVGLIVAVSCWLRARNTMILYNREGKDLE